MNARIAGCLGGAVILLAATPLPALQAGVPLPAGLADPLRPGGNAKPDIGAIPADGEPLKVGIDGRVTADDVRR